MKFAVTVAAVALAAVAFNTAMAQTRSESCAAYAREAARQTPTTTGVARGAARGAVGGAIFGDAGRGAAAGAVVGGTRRVAQRSRSYQFYYNECMSR
ncbi:MAG TPA: glycine zipper family protein [Pseudolabrys sp.]|nr:glycine zipper family protein [Pseudolabrys sp.]